jgi:mycothiol synthase
MSITVRPYVRGQDDAARVDVYNRARAEDEDYVPWTIDDIRLWDQSPREMFRYRFVAELDGIPVGFAYAAIDPKLEKGKGFMSGPHVVPESRRRRVGTALAHNVLAYLVERGMTRAEITAPDRPDANGFLKSLGFEPFRSYSEMRRPLDTVPHNLGESGRAELTLVEPTGDNLATIIRIENQAFAEYYNHQPLTMEQLQYLVEAKAKQGSVSHISIARLDGEPVGYLWYGYEPKEIAHLKKRLGGFLDLGVLKHCRGHGVAKAMMIAAMEHLKSDGMEEVWLYVDDMNLTSAKRLYERLGFRTVERDLAHQKDLCSTGEEE